MVLLPAQLAHLVEAEQAPEAGEAWPTDVYDDPVPAVAGGAPRPVPNQKRAPCTPGLEVEFSGVCWLWLGQKPPQCPPQSVAHEGKCYLPVAVSRPVPATLDGGEQKP